MPAPVLYIVKATITLDREEEFNDWYNKVHIPDVLKFPGILSARRYKAIMGEDRWQYLACYEFESEDALQAYLASDLLKALIRDYDERYGGVSERSRSAYRLVYAS